MICTPTRYYSSHQFKKNEMSGACGMHGGEEKFMTLQWGNLREQAHLEDHGADGSVVLKRFLKKWARRTCTGLLWLVMGTSNEPLVCIKFHSSRRLLCTHQPVLQYQ
jgi:hypothetical protein